MDHDGDDLEDDFVIDEIVAFSAEEEDVQLDDGAFFSDISEKSQPLPAVEIKNTEPKAAKKRRREKEKERKAKKRKITEVLDATGRSMSAQSPRELSQYLTSLQAKVFPKSSTIELNDLKISESSIVDTTSWEAPRTLDELVNFIDEVLPTLKARLSQKSKASGAPTLLFVASAALRVADVARVLKNKKLRGEKGGEVAKLFAKHFKLSEHVTYLKRTKVGAAVGTPGRIGKLLCETDALTESALSHIIIDTTFRDSKNRTLFDIPETRDEVFKTVLGAPKILTAMKEGKIKVVLF